MSIKIIEFALNILLIICTGYVAISLSINRKRFNKPDEK